MTEMRKRLAQVIEESIFIQGPGYLNWAPGDLEGGVDGWVSALEIADALTPLIREAQAEALEEFAERWHEWMIDDAPQTRGGAAYRARAVAGEYRERAAAYRVGEGS